MGVLQVRDRSFASSGYSKAMHSSGGRRPVQMGCWIGGSWFCHSQGKSGGRGTLLSSSSDLLVREGAESQLDFTRPTSFFLMCGKMQLSPDGICLLPGLAQRDRCCLSFDSGLERHFPPPTHGSPQGAVQVENKKYIPPTITITTNNPPRNSLPGVAYSAPSFYFSWNVGLEGSGWYLF